MLKKDQSPWKWTGIIFLLFLFFIFTPLSAKAYTAQYGNTTIIWDIENIAPATLSTPANNCRFIDADPIRGTFAHYYCDYFIWDPPADKEIILSSSVTSTAHTNHRLNYMYLDQQAIINLSGGKDLYSKTWLNTTLTNAESGIGFYFWIDDASYKISYSNDLGERIVVEIKPVFSNPDLYLARYGGPHNNDDTCFCDSSSYPERPGIKHCVIKKGSGPGL
jgi:hypothetical protein